jgi:hypothetical protein
MNTSVSAASIAEISVTYAAFEPWSAGEPAIALRARQ